MTRAGDETPADTDARPASTTSPSKGASVSPGVEVAASYVEDRQSRSLHGEPSTSEQVQRCPQQDQFVMKEEDTRSSFHLDWR